MISCEVVRRHVDAMVDGEVDPDTHFELEQHLAACGPCRVHLAFAGAFKERVREACPPATAPSALSDRIRAALDAEDARRVAARPGAPIGGDPTSPRFPARPPMGVAGVRLLPVKARYAVPAAAAAVALAMIASREGGNPVASEGLVVDTASTLSGASIFEEVLRRHSSEHPPEVTGPPTQVATWFRDKVHFSVRPIEFARPDVRLVGARLSNVRDREAAAFFYDVHGRRVTVMVFERPGPVDHFARPTRVSGRSLWYGYSRGRTVPVVEHHGLTYAIAGDLEERALLQLAATAHVR